MEETRSDLRSKRVHRLALLLIWEGRLSRARLREIYGLSPVRASEWLREFRDSFPGWTVWESKPKSYRASEEAYREWREGVNNVAGAQDSEFADYLSQVGLSAADLAASGVPMWSAFRDFSTPAPRVFATLRTAIEQRRTVELTYRSMREPAPHKRLIEPHSLVRAGRRWHIRGYSTTNGDFRDYSLGRIVSVQAKDDEARHGAEDDAAWQTAARVAIVAHPRLSQSQAEVVRFEYFQGTASRIENCRGALVPYLVQDLRAATDPKVQLPPDYQLAVGNIKEVSRWLFPT